MGAGIAWRLKASAVWLLLGLGTMLAGGMGMMVGMLFLLGGVCAPAMKVRLMGGAGYGGAGAGLFLIGAWMITEYSKKRSALAKAGLRNPFSGASWWGWRWAR